MKIYNKFIAVGLGLGLSFTGTYISHSWFTDSAKLDHVISIGEFKEWKPIGVRFGCMHNQDSKKLTFDMTGIINGNIKHHKVVSGTGLFEGAKEDDIGMHSKKISIEGDKTFNNLPNNFSDDNKVIIEITRMVTIGQNKYEYTDKYEFQVRCYKEGREFKLEAMYNLIETNEPKELKEELEAEDLLPEIEEDSTTDQIDPPTTDGTLEDENNGAETIPELDNEDNQETEEIPGNQTSENQPVTLPLEGENQ